jgi:hypothetical protein
MAVVIGSDQTGQAIQEPVVIAAAPLAAVHQGAHRAGEALLGGSRERSRSFRRSRPSISLRWRVSSTIRRRRSTPTRFALTRRAPGSTT